MKSGSQLNAAALRSHIVNPIVIDSGGLPQSSSCAAQFSDAIQCHPIAELEGNLGRVNLEISETSIVRHDQVVVRRAEEIDGALQMKRVVAHGRRQLERSDLGRALDQTFCGRRIGWKSS